MEILLYLSRPLNSRKYFFLSYPISSKIVFLENQCFTAIAICRSISKLHQRSQSQNRWCSLYFHPTKWDLLWFQICRVIQEKHFGEIKKTPCSSCQGYIRPISSGTPYQGSIIIPKSVDYSILDNTGIRNSFSFSENFKIPSEAQCRHRY